MIKKAHIKTWIVTGDELETIKALSKAIKFKDNYKTFFQITEIEKAKDLINNYDSSKHCLIMDGITFQ